MYTNFTKFANYDFFEHSDIKTNFNLVIVSYTSFIGHCWHLDFIITYRKLYIVLCTCKTIFSYNIVSL